MLKKVQRVQLKKRKKMDDLASSRELVLKKSLEAGDIIKKIDTELYRFWNLIIAEKRLHIVKETHGEEIGEKKS